MKILHVVNTFPGMHRRTGGGEQACRRLIDKLAARGISSCLMTTPFDKAGAVSVDGRAVVPVEGIESWCGPLAKYIEVLKWYAWQNDPLVYRAALRLMKSEKPDVVHLHNMYLLTFAVARAAKALGIPVCLSVYDYWYFCPLSTLLDVQGEPCRRVHGPACAACLPPVMRGIQKLLLSLRPKVFSEALSLVDRFIVLSDSSRNILHACGIGDGRIDTIPAVLPEEFSRSFPDMRSAQDGSPSVLFIGWLQQRKGLHVALDAMEIVWKAYPRVRLTVITQDVKWEKEYRDAMNRRLGAIGNERLTFLSGPRARQEIESSIREAGVVIIPEQWENMSPLLLMEAMFMGKAVVASRIGGIPEFVEEGVSGLLAPSDDSASFARQILYLLQNTEAAARLGACAQERIRSLVGEGNPEGRTEEVYRKLCAQR